MSRDLTGCGNRVALGRMRIDQAFFFFLKWPLLLSIASVVTVVVVVRG